MDPRNNNFGAPYSQDKLLNQNQRELLMAFRDNTFETPYTLFALKKLIVVTHLDSSVLANCIKVPL